MVSAVTFLMMELLPGDVAYDIAGFDASVADIEAIREKLGLDRHIIIRYGEWLSGVLKGNLGKSHRTHENVASAILSRLPVTIELMLITQIIALAMAIPLGIISAYRPRSKLDRCIGFAAFGFMSIPVFVMGLVLIYLFAVKLKWLPATGYVPITKGVWANIRSFILPGLSIALVEWVYLMRVLRSDLIVVLQEDYILTAKAKGLPSHKILFHHALKPASFTLITILGIQIGHLIGGALIVEIIFALPGVGRLLVGAIYGRDVNMVQGCILFITAGYAGINVLVDSLYSFLDPRIRKRHDG